ncbi:MAG: sodium/proline symporter [Gammaproteobacteria bacterium]
MSRGEAILYTLVAYMLVLVAIGLWATRRTRDTGDFFLGGRRLGAWVAAISASASSSSAWTLLAVSGMAYLWGTPALWLFPATLTGFLINWLWVGPRLMEASRKSGAITLTEFLAGPDATTGWARRIVVLASVVVIFSFTFYVAAQFQAAGHAFAAAFDLRAETALLIGAGVVLVYTLLGGFWAVSVTDTLQGLLMAATALLLPLVAVAAVGGARSLADGLTALPPAPDGPPAAGLASVGFIAGTLGIGLGYPGQPHVVNRFMALRDSRALARGRVIAIAWAVVIYAGMLLLGLCARVLYPGLPEGEQVLFEVANRLFAPLAAGVMIAAVLSAIMSTADSQLLVAASSVSHDLPRTPREGLTLSRLVVLAICVLAVIIALFAPQTIFTRVLFAWHALGAAFGPPLVVKLAGRHIEPGILFAAMAVGFAGTVGLYWLPDTPGDWAERLLPLAASLAICIAGSRSGSP